MNVRKKTKRPKIAFVFNQNFFLGGGEISFLELIRNLNHDLFSVTVMVPEDGEIKDYFTLENRDVSVTPFAPLKYLILGPLFFSLIQFMKIIKKERVNLLHANGSRACFYSVLAGRLLGIPVIWHVRETIQDYFLYDGFMGLLARRIVCVSRSVQSKRFRRFGKPVNRKITVVYNGVDTAKFHRDENTRRRFRKRLGIHDREILFGVIGNYTPLKSQDSFLKAFAGAKRIKPNLPAKLLLVGRPLDVTYYQSLKRLAVEMAIEEEVIFLDYMKAIAQVFFALDVFVLPSIREGFSRSLLEAMSSGLPILATRLSEIEEAVQDGENGLLVASNHVQEMTEAILRLGMDRDLRMHLGEQNRARALNCFDISRHIKAIETIYQNLTAGY